MTSKEEVLNGINVAEMREYIEECRRNPAAADRNPTVLAKWMGGARAQVTFGSTVVHLGGDDDPSAMRMLLATLAACDVEVVATHAALLGLKLEALEIEASGHFNVRRLLGLEGPAPGYDRMGYTVHIRAPDITPDQLARLKELCERGSPVGDTLARAVPTALEFKLAAE
jgi:uncharacterized OsmC-like protein